MGVLSGYLRSSTQLYQTCILREGVKPREQPCTTEASDVAEIQAEEEGPAEAASSTGLTGTGGFSRPRRKVDVKALHKRATGTLTYVLELLASNLLRILCIMMSVVSEPLAREHAVHMVMVRQGAAAVRLTYALMATGIWKFTVVAVIRTMCDLVSLKRMSLDCIMAPLRRSDIDEQEAYRYVRTEHSPERRSLCYTSYLGLSERSFERRLRSCSLGWAPGLSNETEGSIQGSAKA